MNIRIETLYEDLGARMEALRADAGAVRASRAVVDAALQDGKTYYGINTGFGALANRRVGAEDLKKLQENLLLSHSVGVGELIPKEISQLMLQLKVHALGLGNSGISEGTFEQLLA
ncbi:MAG: aromatic amino acid lyase, partial [Balneolaceae bacterium]